MAKDFQSQNLISVGKTNLISNLKTFWSADKQRVKERVHNKQ